ncbi:prolyl oligopeptidase family serine peptidase [Kordiimonas sp. SCSIO 12610]|uniref:S9 family peptidase n=1 Tax=Kordiimonas sp. SCSIO 12610 TaxID=2829597 RepID=UPI00210CB00B|nr:prolyl oligopeptidase family serine peptidase [Kordiimonas sp. SCSIO 12610]UTW54671.1 S9 family peptidase [Kordiimonas sp. SCSIO 12610]
MNNKLGTLAVAGAIMFGACKASADQIDEATKLSEAMNEARLIERQSLLNRHAIRLIRLSPDGRYLVFTQRVEKYTKVWMHDLSTSQNHHLFTSQIISDIQWSVDATHLIMETRSGVATASMDAPSSPAHLVNIDRDTHEFYHGIDQSSPHHILASLYNDNDETWTLYRIGMDGKKEALHTGKQKVYSFITYNQGPLRLMAHDDGLVRRIMTVSEAGESEVHQCDYHDDCELAGYDPATDTVYLEGRLAGEFKRLYSIDLKSGALTSLHTDPQNRFDIDRIRFDPITKKPIIAEYETDFREVYAVNDQVSAHVATIKASLNSRDVRIDTASQDRWLIIDSDPGRAQPRFYIYDLKKSELSRPLAAFIANNSPTENPVQSGELAIRIPFWHKASDAFDLQGYVTFPRGRKISEAPMVVVPHGGPWNRVDGSFSGDIQLLANRGYIVFEPNFRSSTGFGREYILQSDRDFGNGRVQQDIIDGTEYLLARGIGDRNKLAIFGHSFGGFSTMAALSFTPEMFQVGIAGAPPPSLTKTLEYYIKQQDRTRAGVLRTDVVAKLAVDINDPQDRDRLYRQSPDAHADKVVKPLYIIAGERDKRVNILDVRDYAIRVEQNGVKVSMLSDSKEGHNFRNPVAIEAYFYFLETVLSYYLGGRHEPISEKKLERYLKKNIVMGNLPTIHGKTR